MKRASQFALSRCSLGRTAPRGLVPGHGLLRARAQCRCRLDEDRHGPVLAGAFHDCDHVFMDRVVGGRGLVRRARVDTGLFARYVGQIGLRLVAGPGRAAISFRKSIGWLSRTAWTYFLGHAKRHGDMSPSAHAEHDDSAPAELAFSRWYKLFFLLLGGVAAMAYFGGVVPKRAALCSRAVCGWRLVDAEAHAVAATAKSLAEARQRRTARRRDRAVLRCRCSRDFRRTAATSPEITKPSRRRGGWRACRCSNRFCQLPTAELRFNSVHALPTWATISRSKLKTVAPCKILAFALQIAALQTCSRGHKRPVKALRLNIFAKRGGATKPSLSLRGAGFRAYERRTVARVPRGGGVSRHRRRPTPSSSRGHRTPSTPST